MKNYLRHSFRLLLMLVILVATGGVSNAQYGANQVLNPGFEDGAASNWLLKTLQDSDADLTSSDQSDAASGSMAAKIETTVVPTSGAIGKIALFADQITITDNKPIKFGCKVKASTAGMEFKISILANNDDGAAKYGSSAIYSVSTDYQTFQFVYTPTDGYNLITIRLQLDGVTLGTYYIDDVVMQTVEGIANNDFEDAIDFAWVTAVNTDAGAEATFSSSSDANGGSFAFEAVVSSAGEKHEDASLTSDTKRAVTGGEAHCLKFYAKASETNTEIKVGLSYMGVGGSYHSQYMQYITITDEYQLYEICVKPVAEITAAKAKLMFGAAEGTYYFDDFSIEPTTNDVPIVIASRANEFAKVGREYTYTVSTNQPVNLSVTTDVEANWLTMGADNKLIGTPSQEENIVVTITAEVDGNSVQQIYTMEVTEPGISSEPVTFAAIGEVYEYTAVGNVTGTFSITIDPALDWLTVDNTTMSGTPTSAMTGTVSIVFDYGEGVDTQIFSIESGIPYIAPLFTSTPVTAGVQNVAYTYAPTADGNGVLTFNLSTDVAAAWLSIDPTTGELSGTPDVGATIVVNLTVDDGTNSDTQGFTLVIAAYTAPSITSTAVTTATVGVEYSYQITFDGGGTFAMQATPAASWLSIDANTGLISGTPDADGQVVVSVTLDDGTNSTSQEYTLTVEVPYVAPSITSTAVTTATVAVAYSYQVTFDGTGSFSISTDITADWLSIDATTGLLSGTPDAVADVVVTITLDDGTSTDTQEFTINLSPNSINNETASQRLILHPNPATDNIYFKNLESKANVTIYNIIGKVVLESEVSQDEAIDVSALNGVFIVKVKTANTENFHKLIVK